jgi:hypothetical protein
MISGETRIIANQVQQQEASMTETANRYGRTQA